MEIPHLFIFFSGKCNAKTRGNAFSVTIEDIETNKTTGIWIDQNTVKDDYDDDYDLKHSEEHSSSQLYDDSQSQPLIGNVSTLIHFITVLYTRWRTYNCTKTRILLQKS